LILALADAYPLFFDTLGFRDARGVDCRRDVAMAFNA